MTERRHVATIRIDYEVPSQNMRDKTHWSKRRKQNQEIAWRIRHARPPGALVTTDCKRHVEILAYRKRRISDHGNLVGGAKSLIDALVTEKCLLDDSDKHATFEYHQELMSAAGYKKPVTVIYIFEIP